MIAVCIKMHCVIKMDLSHKTNFVIWFHHFVILPLPLLPTVFLPPNLKVSICNKPPLLIISSPIAPELVYHYFVDMQQLHLLIQKASRRNWWKKWVTGLRNIAMMSQYLKWVNQTYCKKSSLLGVTSQKKNKQINNPLSPQKKERKTDRQTDRQTDRDRQKERINYILATYMYMFVVCFCHGLRV